MLIWPDSPPRSFPLSANEPDYRLSETENQEYRIGLTIPFILGPFLGAFRVEQSSFELNYSVLI